MLMGFIYVYSKEFSLVLAKWKYAMDFPGGPVVKTSYAGGMGLTPCWGTKIPNAGCSQKNKNNSLKTKTKCKYAIIPLMNVTTGHAF